MVAKINEPHGRPGRLTQEDVWGELDHETLKLKTKGMIVARGLPPADKDDRYAFSVEQRLALIAQTYPTICPVWGDELPYKSVTVVCANDQVEEVSYWLEYVHGGGSVSDIRDLDGGRVALRSDYRCW